MVIQTKEIWSAQPTQKDFSSQSISSVDFKPGGEEIAVCIGKRVKIYSTDGKLVRQLKGHKGAVSTLSYTNDGCRLASGGADKYTIIWDEDGKGVSKFAHTERVQVVVYNPSSNLLASCCSVDFGFWSPEDKSILKHKVESTILCAAWNKFGNILAIGLTSGVITLRDVNGKETASISSRCGPVWTLRWNDSVAYYEEDILVVGCWDCTMSFYNTSGEQVYVDQKMDFLPCSTVQCGEKNEFMLCGGSGREVTLHNKEGLFLACLARHDGWVWSIAVNDDGTHFATIDNTGKLSYFAIEPHRAQSWCMERFAYRDCGTDVVLEYFSTRQENRIKCDGYVKKVAVSSSNNYVAVQLANSYAIFDANDFQQDDSQEALTEKKFTIDVNMDCNFMALLLKNLLLVSDCHVLLYNWNGKKEREWKLGSSVKCLKIVPCSINHEGVVLGLMDGRIVLIFIDNPTPMELAKHSKEIACLDLSCFRRYIAIVDIDQKMHVYDRMEEQFLSTNWKITEPIKHVLFHDEIEDLLCCCGTNGVVTVQDFSGPTYSQDVENSIGFYGNQIFYLDRNKVRCVDIIFSSIVTQLIQLKDYEKAYRLATYGVSNQTWKMLAHHAMIDKDLIISGKAFRKVNDPIIEHLTHHNSLLNRSGPDTFAADIAALRGDFQEAKTLYVQAGCTERAIHMFVAMKDFEEARNLVQKGEGNQEMMNIIRKEADWQVNRNPERASELYFQCNEFVRAVKVVGEGKCEAQVLVNMVNKLPDNETEALQICCSYLMDMDGMEDDVRRIYMKLGNHSKLMDMLVRNKNLFDAISLFEQHGHKIEKSSLLSLIDWLILKDRIIDAMRLCSYLDVDNNRFALDLAQLGIKDKRFRNVSRLCWMVSKNDMNYSVGEFDCLELSRCYYAYAHIHEYFTELFTSVTPQVILHASCFLLNSFQPENTPDGISYANILIALVKHASSLGFSHIITQANARLRRFKLSPEQRENIGGEITEISVPSQHAQESLSLICYRCGTSNMLLEKLQTDSVGNSCTMCKHPFFRCFSSFDVLSLVEFVPEATISDDEALSLIHQRSATQISGMNNSLQGAIDASLTSSEEAYSPVEMGRDALLSLNRENVYVIDNDTQNSSIRRKKYYVNMIPDIGIAVCQTCHSFFHESSFEYEYLRNGGCPFCNAKQIGNYGHT